MLIKRTRLPIKEILLIGMLPGFLKKLVYRLKGYRIGKKVSIGFGSVVCGSKVAIGDYTSIGFLTIIRGKQIDIGEHVSIGSTSFLDTPFIEIGDGSHINEQVFVGGLQFPDSRLSMGKNCQIMQMSFLNPARWIRIGDDSGIGGNCLLFGHNSWLSRFEGYPVDFEPIEIGRSVSVSWGAFLLPGTKVGDGAVIGAHSVVHRSVPEKCLAIGFPARVVSKYPDFPKEVGDEEKLTLFQGIVTEMIEFFKGSGLVCQSESPVYNVMKSRNQLMRRTGKSWRFRVADKDLSDEAPQLETHAMDVLLSLWTIPEKLRQRLNKREIMWIDVENKEQSDHDNDLGREIVLFLRRYGVRFNRIKA